LYIGGAGLARGYLGHPESTAERFVPHTFHTEPGARLYKTHDLARHLPNGEIEYLERIDHLVKVRGFRVELREIEAILARHPAVREAVVLARDAERTPGNKRLVAYFVPQSGMTATTRELRSFLEEHLPRYMLPSAYVSLAEFPLTPTRKLDRRALPAPEPARPDLEAAYVAPRTEVERTISAVWQDVLQIEQVGIHDNFFDLGGHSLLMVQVHSRLLLALQREISIVELFKYPTIYSLAKHLSQAQSEQPSFQESQARAQKQREALQRQKQRMAGRATQKRAPMPGAIYAVEENVYD
jgi:acyl carrier protein